MTPAHNGALPDSDPIMHMESYLRALSLLATLAMSATGQCLTSPSQTRSGDTSANNAASGISPLASLNRALPGWLCFSGGYRARFEGFDGAGFQANSSDSYLLTRFRLGVLIKPISWVHAYAEVQDATAFWKQPPLAPPYQHTWDLRRAYIDLGSSERSPLTARVGRQDLDFGSGRLVGTSYWRNASKGFDAAMVTVQSGRFRVRAFAASPVVAQVNGLSHHQQGNNLHGLYGALSKLIPGSVVEPYAFWRLTPRIRSEAGPLAKMDEKTIGLRWAGKAKQFDYDAEYARQTGTIGSDRIRASAAGAIVGYTFDAAPLKPRIFGEVNFASGDGNAKNGVHNTFDLLYPNTHNRHGMADQVGWQNLKEIRSGARVSLRRNWTAAAVFTDWWLANAKDAFYNSSGGAIARDPKGLSGTHVGVEADLETTWRLNRELELGAGVGRIFPGRFLNSTNHRHAYTYPYVIVNYNFF
jgi:hypothetical protein